MKRGIKKALVCSAAAFTASMNINCVVYGPPPERLEMEEETQNQISTEAAENETSTETKEEINFEISTESDETEAESDTSSEADEAEDVEVNLDKTLKNPKQE